MGEAHHNGKDVALSSIRVLIVDHQPLIRSALVRLLDRQTDCQVVAEAEDVDDAAQLLAEIECDIVIADLSCTNGDTKTFIKTVTQTYQRSLLVFTNQNESSVGARLILDGARGFLHKSAAESEILLAIQTVARRDLFLSGTAARQLLSELLNNGGSSEQIAPDVLTSREMEVYELIGQCCSSREIAENLQVSIKTVNAHRAHIRAKLGLTSATDLTRRAVEWHHYQIEQAHS